MLFNKIFDWRDDRGGHCFGTFLGILGTMFIALGATINSIF